MQTGKCDQESAAESRALDGASTMTESNWLTEHFEKNRSHLRRVAFRMLGSSTEADDAVQEAWTRVSRTGAGDVENLGRWLTTIVARVCLDMLRSRASRREVQAGDAPPEEWAALKAANDPEADIQLADSIGPALLVVLETLSPAERVAFVLHDMFDLTFEEIAPVVGRLPAAARQLASRARRRVQGGAAVPEGELRRHREIVSAFLAASRDGNFEALLAVLDPNVVLRADHLAVQTAAAYKQRGAPDLAREMHGARAVAEAFKGRARGAQQALIDGTAGAIWAQAGKTRAVFAFTIDNEKIVEID